MIPNMRDSSTEIDHKDFASVCCYERSVNGQKSGCMHTVSDHLYSWTTKMSARKRLAACFVVLGVQNCISNHVVFIE